MKLSEIEEVENKYLKKYFYFFKYVENEMFNGFKSMYDIEKNWRKFWGTNKSDFSTGAERVVYGLLNGKAFGSPNSTPVSSDLMFEMDDAFIHIDVKTYGESNLKDFTTSHTIEANQTSYFCEIMEKPKNGGRSKFIPTRVHSANLPDFYTKKDGSKKICLTYFISILTENYGRDIMCIVLTCLPNIKLKQHYKYRPIKAGKNSDSFVSMSKNYKPFKFGKGRFDFKEVGTFELLPNTPSRVKVIYYDVAKCSKYTNLDLIKSIYNRQGDI
ncbi:hypothetical protein [Aliarcobacter butzleri]|uniref:hypothetical protein n=1 Tax=Aliarcobacter TaxID=2321111 RepID=UPI002B2513C0|nr:hypothetical protein [Aliarcobacter butzleri]